MASLSSNMVRTMISPLIPTSSNTEAMVVWTSHCLDYRLKSASSEIWSDKLKLSYNKAHRSIKPTISQSLSAHVKGSGPSPNPSPAGKGRSMWGYPYRAADKRIERSLHPLHRGISVITPLPFGGGVGGGAALSYSLFFSHRTTQKNRNHKGAQRH